MNMAVFYDDFIRQNVPFYRQIMLSLFVSSVKCLHRADIPSSHFMCYCERSEVISFMEEKQKSIRWGCMSCQEWERHRKTGPPQEPGCRLLNLLLDQNCLTTCVPSNYCAECFSHKAGRQHGAVISDFGSYISSLGFTVHSVAGAANGEHYGTIA